MYHPERLRRILTNTERPVLLILAGKAHPGDGVGQAMIRDWIHFINQPDIKQKLVFLSDDDAINRATGAGRGFMDQYATQTLGSLWHPGGMKVLVNGGLNCSELDG